MSEYNDYKWYDGNENSNNEPAVHFYTETVTENKKDPYGCNGGNYADKRCNNRICSV